MVQPDPKRPGKKEEVKLDQFARNDPAEGRWYDEGEELQSGYQEKGGFAAA